MNGRLLLFSSQGNGSVQQYVGEGYCSNTLCFIQLDRTVVTDAVSDISLKLFLTAGAVWQNIFLVMPPMIIKTTMTVPIFFDNI